jgi:hypothetical protein
MWLSAAELILYYRQHEKRKSSIEEIRKWRDEIKKGMKPFSLAKTISEGKQREDHTMDRET